MGVFGGPKNITTGLGLILDTANYKSFKGVPTTNLLPSPTVNAYPTVGNSWGTYNTNQYGSGTYFSIGTVSSVSSNIVTMTAAHSLRTYDVMQPQTTGGGVTAATNYYIKKISSTQFSLHEYNSSQDGTQGYINPSTGNHKVYDSIANDTKISINSTNFPTMWWGYPHLPNAGLVKELITNGFSDVITGLTSDCIRLHYIRTDDVKDGMSYGVDATVTPNTNHTISFYTRSPDERSVGKVITYYIYNYTGGNATAYSWNFTLGPVGVWQRQSFTYSPAYGTMISYWFPVSGGVYSWDWSCMQVESGSVASPFVAGTRGATVDAGGGWLDLSINASKFSNGQYAFPGYANGYLTFTNNGTTINHMVSTTQPSTSTSTQYTRSAWFYLTGNNSGWSPIIQNQIGNNSDMGLTISGNRLHFRQYTKSQSSGTANGDYGVSGTLPVNLNQWYMGTMVVNLTAATVTFYLNGVLDSVQSINTIGNSSSDTIIIGGAYTDSYSGERMFKGNIAMCSHYNRLLSADEVLQIFNSTRSRFGI